MIEDFHLPWTQNRQQTQTNQLWVTVHCTFPCCWSGTFCLYLLQTSLFLHRVFHSSPIAALFLSGGGGVQSLSQEHCVQAGNTTIGTPIVDPEPILRTMYARWKYSSEWDASGGFRVYPMNTVCKVGKPPGLAVDTEAIPGIPCIWWEYLQDGKLILSQEQ